MALWQDKIIDKTTRIRDIPETSRVAFIPFPGSRPNVGYRNGVWVRLTYKVITDPWKAAEEIMELPCVVVYNDITGHVDLMSIEEAERRKALTA